MKTNFQKEFPDFGNLPEVIAAMVTEKELIDISYHNDAMPSFILARDDARVDRDGSTDNVPVLWVDYADESKREDHGGTKRFMVKNPADVDDTFETDDENEAIARLIRIEPKKEERTIDAELTALGFALVGTGGGCEAWELPLSNGLYVMITDGEASAPTDNDSCVCFLMTREHSEPICSTEYRSGLELVRVLKVSLKGGES